MCITIRCCFISWTLVCLTSYFGESRKQVVAGFYSSCKTNSFINRTDFVNKSSNIQEKVNLLLRNFHPEHGYNYMHSDVCLNQTEMTRILVEILLNKTFRSKDTDGSFRKESDVLSIVAYITQELFKLLTRLLSFTQIIIVEANKEIDLDNFNEHHKYVVPYQNFIATIDEQIQKFHWVKVAVIYLKNPTLDEEYFKFCYKSLVEIIKKRSNQCVQALSVDTTEPSSIEYALSLLTKHDGFIRSRQFHQYVWWT